MPMTEKEYNGNLLDQLSILDDIERVAKKVDCKEVQKKLNINAVK